MKKRTASLGLDALDTSVIDKPEPKATKPKKAVVAKAPVEEKLQQAAPTPTKKKKQPVPLYVEQPLHDALHTLVFTERHKKTTFQTLFLEGLDLLLEKRGLPSVEELSSGQKTLNP